MYRGLRIEADHRKLAARAEAVIRSQVSTYPGGISHREIAERAGLSKSFVTRFLNGQAPNPTLYTLAALAAALDCRIELNLQPEEI